MSLKVKSKELRFCVRVSTLDWVSLSLIKMFISKAFCLMLVKKNRQNGGHWMNSDSFSALSILCSDDSS